MKKTFQTAVLGAMLGIFPSTIAQATNFHTNYAVLFSGGFNKENNHDRYYNQTLRMWDITTNLLGFDVENVYVLFADGTDLAVDRSSNLNSDWSSIISAGGNIEAATYDNLSARLTALSSIITPQDSFYFWAFNHGENPSFPNCPNVGPNAPDFSTILNKVTPKACNLLAVGNPDDVLLTAWGTPSIRDDELAAWVNPINAKAEVYAFAQCFSGGMVDDLFPAPNRFAAWAAAANECSFGDGWADAWADGIMKKLWSTLELGQYAKLNDIYGGGPGSNKETPGWTGHNTDLVSDEEIKDLGDAPDSYKTLTASDGPRYEEGVFQKLGVKWDGEPDGQPTPRANGDDLSLLGKFDPVVNDEDGVIFGESWVDVLFKITRPGDNKYQLRAWWDTDKNSFFDHPTNMYIDDLLILSPGFHKKRYNLSFNPKDYYSRFRLTWEPLKLDVKPWGEYFSKDCTSSTTANCVSHGEVEDYAPIPEPSSVLSIFAFGALGASSILKRQQKTSK